MPLHGANAIIEGVTATTRTARKARVLTERQEEILDIIRHFVRTKGFPPSIREIARGLGLSSVSTVHCHLINLEKKGYIRKDPSRRRSIELVREGDLAQTDVVWLPVLDAEELAALPDGDHSLHDTPYPEVVPLALSLVGKREAFLVHNQGESMRDAGMLHGDLLVAWRQSRADDGDIVVALVNDEITVKRFYRADDLIRLDPENQRMRPIFVKEARILGKVVGVVRKLL